MTGVEIIKEICVLIATIVVTIPSIVGAVVALVKLIKTKDWNAIKKIADTAMLTVEKYSLEHPNMTSDEKLEMAIQTIRASVAELGIKFEDKYVDQIKEYIKVSIDWFNSMNK